VPEFVGIGTYSNAEVTLDHLVPIPAGSPGDVLLLFADTGSGSATMAADDGFTPLTPEVGDTMQARAWIKVADGTEGADTTVSLSVSYSMCGAVARYSGVNTSGANPYRDFESVAPITASATAPSRAALAGTTPTDLVVGCWLPQDSNKGAVIPSQFSGGWAVRAAIGHPAASSKDTTGLMVMDLLGATNDPVVTDGNANSKWVVFDLSLIAAARTSDLLSMFGL
jgi:hypothetical protein